MTDATGESEAAAEALALIAAAFAEREPPAVMSDSLQLSDVEYAEVMAFDGLAWPEVTFEMIEVNADAVFWFAPAAFCYYLPGFLAAGLKADRRDTNAYDALIGMLDRSPEPAWWDDFFRPRWTRLVAAELDAVAAWVRWFQAAEPEAFHDNSFARALATLALLKARRAVTAPRPPALTDRFP
jgi:hypothetical protein